MVFIMPELVKEGEERFQDNERLIPGIFPRLIHQILIEAPHSLWA